MFNRITGFMLVFAIATAFWSAPVSIFSAHPAYAAEKSKPKPKKSEGGEGGAEGAIVKHPDYEYINLKPLVLPIITDRGLTQQLSLLVSLELPYGKLEDVALLEPRLADAYLQDLYGVLGAGGAMMQGSVVDIVAIKKRLTTITTKVLGAENFHDVLLQVVQQRPM
jgi:hypothetical protein